jgi:hypothetical protein
MPAAFALHIAEEYLGGFPAWVTHVLGGSFSNVAFAFNNAAFFVIMLGLTVWVARSRSQLAVFLLIAWASGNIFWDGLFHVLTTANSRERGSERQGFPWRSRTWIKSSRVCDLVRIVSLRNLNRVALRREERDHTAFV